MGNFAFRSRSEVNEPVQQIMRTVSSTWDVCRVVYSWVCLKKNPK